MDSPGLSPDEPPLLRRLALGEVAAFEAIFWAYYKPLCRFALRYVPTGEIAEELVSDVLTRLWQDRHTLDVRFSLRAYLFAAVKNTCLNHLKSQFARHPPASDDSPEALAAGAHAPAPHAALEYAELERLIEAGIGQLPPACRTIFSLSRKAGLSYEEIAGSLGISKKTVKAQMGIALRKLRRHLHRHWDKLLLLLLPFSK